LYKTDINYTGMKQAPSNTDQVYKYEDQKFSNMQSFNNPTNKIQTI